MTSDTREHYLKTELYNLVRNDSSIFEFLQAGSLDGIWYWDLDNPENEWLSPRFWEVLGYSPLEKEHLASEWQEIIDPQDKVIALENFKKHCQDPYPPYSQIVRYRHKNGSTVWVRCRGIAIRNSEGRPIRFLGAHNDITDLMHSKEELEHSLVELQKRQITLEQSSQCVQDRTAELIQANEFLDLILENIPDMIFVKDAKDLKFVRFNKAGENLLGYSRNELIGKSDYDFFPKPEADHFTSKDRHVFSQGQLLEIEEEQIHTKNKGIRFLHTKKIPVYGVNKEPQYLVGISEDITAKKDAEESRLHLIQEKAIRTEAERGIRLRDDFISIASHELKTPLTALKMQLQLFPKLLQNVSFSEKDKFFTLFTNSLKQLDQFSRLVDELLDVSRIGAGHLILELREMNLSEVVSESIESFRTELRQAGCSIITDLDSSIQGYWDSTRIEQIVWNLLSNALKYAAGKPIHVVAEIKADKARLTVQDQGIGIAKDDIDKIFDRFERVAPVSKYRGLGLGLFITREIVEAHGGRIWVESELGRGSTFIVELPLAKLKSH